MDYPTTDIRFKYYGKHIESLLLEASKVEDPVAQESFLIHIARLMKSFHIEWNHENIDEESLNKHIQLLSGGKLSLDLEKVREHALLEVGRKERQSNPRRSGGHHQSGRPYQKNNWHNKSRRKP